MELLPTSLKINDILQDLNSLSYLDRIRYAAKLGRSFKDSKELKTCLKALLTHPEPPAAEAETDEGFTEIMSTQRKNVSKFYHQVNFPIFFFVEKTKYES